MEIGTRIRLLRKEKGISQDALARQLGVTYLAVSKWENGSTMPDITMLPIIARFFTVSIDYLLDFNLHNADEQVEDLCGQAFALRKEAPAQAEEILREGLRRFPNNEIILDHLVYVLKDQGKLDETVLLCRQLIDSTRDDEIKYDAYFILLDAQAARESCPAAGRTERRPGAFLHQAGAEGTLLDGQEAYEAALDQKGQSPGMALEMLLVIVRHLLSERNLPAARQQLEMAKKVYQLLREDTVQFRGSLFDLEQLKREIDAELKQLFKKMAGTHVWCLPRNL